MYQYQQPYNPMMDYGRPQMQQQYQQQMQPMQQPMQPQQQQVNQSQIIARAVTSIDEAKAAMIDPIGIYLFTDFANNAIYVKKINNNGMAEFYTFEGMGETEKVDPMMQVNERLTSIEKILGGMIDVKSDESVTNVKSAGNAATINKQSKTAKSASVSEV